ncbi:DNA-binding Lrp family transcriptional regulator [Clostridium tetanomorphum]|nr:DNA-binding Lrp family transcriptional regulator [Clostridium tetanomorphum]NRS83611.1 DNA-binding Lrp family transcriptional regulator [Clostridium tetanomorphum]
MFGISSELIYSEEELLKRRKKLKRSGFKKGIVIKKVYED